MTFFKLVSHDLRCGLLKRSYWVTILVAVLPLVQYFKILGGCGLSGSLGDCLLYLFRGELALSFLSAGNQHIQIPVLWILLMIFCLILHTDYFLEDLTSSGQQIVIRSQRRVRWLLSKCTWSVAGGILYYFYILICAIGGCLFTEQALSFSMSEPIAEGILKMSAVQSDQVVFTVVIKPLAALVSMNLLQMMLQILVRPIPGFMICFALLLCALYHPALCFPVSGAIALRNICLPMTQTESWVPVFSAVLTSVVCMIISLWRFSHMDLLRKEDN